MKEAIGNQLAELKMEMVSAPDLQSLNTETCISVLIISYALNWASREGELQTPPALVEPEYFDIYQQWQQHNHHPCFGLFAFLSL